MVSRNAATNPSVDGAATTDGFGAADGEEVTDGEEAAPRLPRCLPRLDLLAMCCYHRHHSGRYYRIRHEMSRFCAGAAGEYAL